MTDTSNAPAGYQALRALSGRMLAAARGAEWDRLAAMEAELRTALESLRAADSANPVPAEAAAQVAQIVNQVLAEGEEIRTLAQAQQSRLSTLMTSAVAERNLNRSYQP